jgi:hypothetical protein
MANSKTIAGLIGPTLVALAATLLINLNSISALVEPVSHDPALVIVSGVLSFVVGSPLCACTITGPATGRFWSRSSAGYCSSAGSFASCFRSG